MVVNSKFDINFDFQGGTASWLIVVDGFSIIANNILTVLRTLLMTAGRPTVFNITVLDRNISNSK